MNFTLRVNVAGAERKFELLADSVRQIDPALKAFDRYLAARVQQRFEQGGPGWAPPSPATLARRRSRAAAALGRRLGREVRRAETRLAKVGGTEGEVSPLASAIEGRFAKRRRSALAALQRRVTTLAEYRRLLASGSREASLFEGRGAEKQRTSLAARMARAEGRAQNQLGAIKHSFQSRIKGGKLVRESRVKWAGVHNEGGAAGNEAQIPARPFLFLEERDVEVLVEILRDRMLLAFE